MLSVSAISLGHPREAMSRLVAGVFTVISLLALLAADPQFSVFHPYGATSLFEFWVLNIAKAIPPAFTLGMCTVLLYKGFRYPRGTAFTVFGLIQLSFVGWLVWWMIHENYAWVSLPILLAAAFVGPKSAKATWKWLDVDRYYKSKIKE